MDERLLKRFKHIEHRSMAILMIVVPVVHSVLDDVAITFGLAFGGCFELLLFYLFRRVVETIVDGTDRDKAVRLLLALGGKLALLGVGLAAAIKLLPVDAAALVIGVGLIVLAILIEILMPADEE